MYMSSHYYTINSLLRCQAKGGAIGSKLTGEVARCYMLNWDRRFRKKVKDIGIKLEIYKRYVNDILLVTRNINKGWHFDGKKMVFSEAVARDDTRTDEERTAEIIVAIANTLEFLSTKGCVYIERKLLKWPIRAL